jgi:CheY-like chemotaxis protein
MKEDHPVVFIVEDDDDDLFLLERELAKAGATLRQRVRDGRAAVDYLAGNAPYGDRQRHPLPDIVFLDLKIPHLSGHGVLAWIRSRPEFAELRVYVLTGSDEPKDRSQSEALGATGYFVKPLLAAQIRPLLESIGRAAVSLGSWVLGLGFETAALPAFNSRLKTQDPKLPGTVRPPRSFRPSSPRR